jgi:threonine dehydrogenase-like Zn-dependent dehydrogenase
MKLRLTHVVRYRVDGTEAWDALATGDRGPEAALGTRWFVPGALPCGECPLCRRTLVGACRAQKAPLEGQPPGAVLDLPERFLTAVDEPPELAPLDDRAALAAGVTAWALQALALANAAAGDLAIWLGPGPLPVAGAQLAAARGARAFLLAPLDGGPALAGVTRAPTAEALAAAVLAAEAGSAAAEGHAAARGQRRLFASSSDAEALAAVAALAGAGSTTVLLGAGAATLASGFALPVEAMIVRSAAYHPDLVPEALAALRRGEVALPVPGVGA